MQLFEKSPVSSEVIMNSFSWERREVVRKVSDKEILHPSKKMRMSHESSRCMEQTLQDGTELRKEIIIVLNYTRSGYFRGFYFR